MTRTQKVEIALGLKRAGASLAEIAAIMEASRSAVSSWVYDQDGSRKRRQNARRSAA